MSRLLLRLVVFSLLLIGLSPPLPAHAHVTESIGYSTIHSAGSTVAYSLELEYQVLARAVELGPGSREAEDDAARAKVLASSTETLTAYLDGRVQMFLDDAACELDLVGTSVGERNARPYAQLELNFACPGSSGAYQLRYDVFAESDAVVDDHSNIVDYRLGGYVGQTVLDWERQEFTVGETSVWASMLRFGTMGIEHILSGADHVLFVLALLLGANSRRQLIGVLSMFTLAHSITLVSALLGWVSVPDSVVEPLIALSIAVVALENLFGAARHRYPVVFSFGLLHGLGFAGSLRVSDDVGWDLVVSLLSFNIGIEVGQALLLVVSVPLLLLVRRLSYADVVVRGVTVLVAMFGIGWFIERIALS